MANADPYESSEDTSTDDANVEFSADQKSLLASTRSYIRLVAIIAGLAALYFALQLFTISWFYFKSGDVGFDQGMSFVQLIRVIWAVVSLFAYAAFCFLLRTYADRIRGVLSGKDQLASIIPIQNGVWFAAGLWIMASAIVYIGVKLSVTSFAAQARF